MKYILKLYLFAFFLLPCFAEAQSVSEIPILRDSRVLNPVPPAPDMASLEKFGNVEFDKSTGAAAYSIPLHTLHYDGVSIPLQLQYASNGFRPSDIGSFLGMHWTLTGIGGISRSIKGLPDESGYLIDPVDQAFINNTVLTITTHATQGIVKQLNKGMDISQDAYSVNVAGLGGKFFINSQKNFVFSLRTGNKLYYQLTTGPLENTIKFWIIDTKGNRYEFETEEKTTIIAQNGYSRNAVTQHGVTAWKITRIVTAGGKEIFFTYADYTFGYATPSHDVFMSQSVTPAPPDDELNCGCSETYTWTYSANTYLYESKILTSISTANETVEFSYADDAGAANYGKKLTAITVRDHTAAVRKKFEFSYGHYSGDARLKLTEFKAIDMSPAPLAPVKHSFSYYENYPVPSPGTRSIDAHKYFNGASNTHLIVAASYPYQYPGASADRIVRPDYARQTLLKEVTYPSGGKTEFVYEANGNLEQNDIGIGLRVKSLVNKDGDNTVFGRKDFVYRDYQSQSPLLVNNTPFETFPEYVMAAHNCERLVLTSDNQFSSVSNTIPLAEEYYYREVDVLEKGSAADLKTTFRYDALEAMNGDMQVRPVEELYYKSSGSTFSLVSEKIHEYAATGLAAYAHAVLQYAVLPSELFAFKAFPDGPREQCIDFYHGVAQSLPRFQVSIKPKKTTERKYEGAAMLQSITEMTFSSQHDMPLSIKTTDSKGLTLKKEMVYPTEAHLLSDPSLPPAQLTLLSAMVQKNILDPVVFQQVTRGPLPLEGGSNITDASLTLYGHYHNLYYRPQERQDRGTDGSYAITSFLDYDNNGNLLSYRKEHDHAHSFIWDQNKMYPIATAVNAAVRDIFHTSFEDTEGNSTAGDSKTGKKSRTGGYSKALSNLTNGPYILSYWQKSGGHWVFQSAAVTVAGGSYTIDLSGQVDEVRFHPSKAQMSTYTYEPLTGMTSSCDINNRITYYEYDGFGRLSLIRDQDRNVVKTVCYNYAGQPGDCEAPCTDAEPDWQNTAAALRCQLNGQGQHTGYREQEQRDMNICSPTYNQTQWVAAGFDTDACPLPPDCTSGNCTGNDKKCIDNVCQTGAKICTSSVRINQTTWLVTYHYKWSDDTVSPDYQEYGPACLDFE